MIFQIILFFRVNTWKCCSVYTRKCLLNKIKTDKALKKIGVNSIFLKNELIRIPQITMAVRK